MTPALIGLGLVTGRGEAPVPNALPPSWEAQDWSLVHRGVDVGPLRIDGPQRLFTTRQPHQVHLSVGNPTDAPHRLVIEGLQVSGGRMAEARQVPLIVATPRSSDEGPAPADPATASIAVPPGEIVAVALQLPHDLDPSLVEASRGTCYAIVVEGRVGDAAFRREGRLCYGERIPRRR